MTSPAPAVVLLLVVWLAWKPRGAYVTGILILGIFLVLGSAIVASLAPEVGLVLVLLCMTCLGFGMGIALFDTQPVPDPAPTIRRIPRFVLAVHVLAPCFAIYVYVLRHGGLGDEDLFNAVFRFVLFVIVYAPITAILLASESSGRAQDWIALVLPVAFAVARGWDGGWEGLYGLLLHLGTVNVVAVGLALCGFPLAVAVKNRDKGLWGVVALLLGVAGISVAVAWGMLRRLGEDLARLEAWTPWELLGWIGLPALIVAVDLLWRRGRRPGTDLGRLGRL